MFESFFWTMAALGVKGAVLIAALAVVDLLLGRRLTPGWRYGLWLVAIARLALPVAPENAWSMHGWTTFRGASRPAETVERWMHVATAKAVEDDGPASIATTTESLSGGNPRVTSVVETLLALWAIGVAALSIWGGGRIAVAYRWLNRLVPSENQRLLAILDDCLRTLRIRRAVRLVVVPGLSSPLVVGCRRPRILLPEAFSQDFDDAEIRMVLLHELAHVKRGDALVACLAEMVRIVHWWNPAAWWALARLATTREAACDALVLRIIGAERRVQYGRTLVRVLEYGFRRADARDIGVPALGMLGRRRAWKGRIAMIMSAKQNDRGPPNFLGIALVATAIGIGLTDAPGAADGPRRPATSSPAPKDDASPGRAVQSERNFKGTQILPLVSDAVSTTFLGPPSENDIRQAMNKQSYRFDLPYFYERRHGKLRFVVMKNVDHVDECGLYPIIGPARLHRCHYKVTIYFDEIKRSFNPFSREVSQPNVEVFYIDKDYLQLCTLAEKKPIP